MSLIVELRSLSLSQHDMTSCCSVQSRQRSRWTGRARAITTMIAKQVFRLDRDEFSRMSIPISMMLVNEPVQCDKGRTRHLSIAMIIANEYLDYDESRERASLDATRVAMNYRMFDRNEEHDNQLKLRTRERMGATITSKETCAIKSID